VAHLEGGAFAHGRVAERFLRIQKVASIHLMYVHGCIGVGRGFKVHFFV
jgi:hypothetical protein